MTSGQIAALREIPEELATRALHDVTLYHALTRVRMGEWTLEHAMIQAALNLSAQAEGQRKRIVEMLSLCTCGACSAVLRERQET